MCRYGSVHPRRRRAELGRSLACPGEVSAWEGGCLASPARSSGVLSASPAYPSDASGRYRFVTLVLLIVVRPLGSTPLQNRNSGGLLCVAGLMRHGPVPRESLARVTTAHFRSQNFLFSLPAFCYPLLEWPLLYLPRGGWLKPLLRSLFGCCSLRLASPV